MVHHQIVRVHDAAGKNAINENLIRIEHFVTFRGIYDGLEPDRPLLKVKVCMLADTQITRATSIPKSDFDEVIDTIVQRLVHIGVQLMRNRALGTGALWAPWLQPVRADVCLAVLASVQHMQQPRACASSEIFRGTQAVAKQKVVGVKWKRKVEIARPTAGSVVPGGVMLVGAVGAEAWAD
jgi:hypothetical protein